MAESILQGIAVSQGIAIGQAFYLTRRLDTVPHLLIPAKAIDLEEERLQAAIDLVKQAFQATKANLPEHLSGHEELIDAHLLICSDPKLLGEAKRFIREKRMNAEWALEESTELIAAIFQQINAPYIRERMQDVRLVAEKIMKRLMRLEEALPEAGTHGILVGYDLTPADTLALPTNCLSGMVTEQGGSTAHTGIVARSLSIPAVVGVCGLEQAVQPGVTVIVDGFAGTMIIDPSPSQIIAYEERSRRFAGFQELVAKSSALPAETEDGHQVSVLANIDVSSDVQVVCASGAEGAGLLRTEFAYLARAKLPTEDELFDDYKHLAESLAPGKVTIRTLDLGADKLLGGVPPLDEANPAMGLRSIRYCLRHQSLFRQQLRAILRASAYGNVEIMFPLICSMKELVQARSFLDEARQELAAEGIPFAANIPVGVMIELPASVLIADILAKEVDFFSIGTNDLIQFTLGVDRGNRYVAHLFQPLHPAVIRSIQLVVDKAHEVGIPVSICGEMAAEPYSIPLLLGMQVDGFSASVQSVPLIKQLIRLSDMASCRALVTRALAARDTLGVQRLVLEYACHCFPDYVPFFSAAANSFV